MQEAYMLEAISQAKKAFSMDEVPVGAVLVDNNRNIIAAASHNTVETTCDPTNHAEMNVIRQLCENLGSYHLENYDIHVTLEPCAMCAHAISAARIRRLYFGAYDIKSGGVEHGARVLYNKSCHHKPEIYGGIMEKECSLLLKGFFMGKR